MRLHYNRSFFPFWSALLKCDHHHKIQIKGLAPSLFSIPEHTWTDAQMCTNTDIVKEWKNLTLQWQSTRLTDTHTYTTWQCNFQSSIAMFPHYIAFSHSLKCDVYFKTELLFCDMCICSLHWAFSYHMNSIRAFVLCRCQSQTQCLSIFRGITHIFHPSPAQPFSEAVREVALSIFHL